MAVHESAVIGPQVPQSMESGIHQPAVRLDPPPVTHSASRAFVLVSRAMCLAFGSTFAGASPGHLPLTFGAPEGRSQGTSPGCVFTTQVVETSLTQAFPSSATPTTHMMETRPMHKGHVEVMFCNCDCYGLVSSSKPQAFGLDTSRFVQPSLPNASSVACLTKVHRPAQSCP